MRSAWAKIKNLASDLIEREADFSILTEVWERTESREHQQLIEELCERNDSQYLSFPRPGRKRGGGVAIVNRNVKFSITRLAIQVPKQLEVCWSLL